MRNASRTLGLNSGGWPRLLVLAATCALLILVGCGGGGGGSSSDGKPTGQTDTAKLNQAMSQLDSGDEVGARQTLEEMAQAGTLGDNGRAMYAAMVAYRAVEDTHSQGTALKAVLDALQLQVVGDSFDSLELIDLSGMGGGATPRSAAQTGLSAADLREAALALRADIRAALDLLADITGGVSLVFRGHEVDDADVLVMKAALQYALAQVEYSLAYDLAEPAIGLEEKPWDLTLRSDAATRLSASKTALLAAIDAAQKAVVAVMAETDDQSNDLLTLDSEALAIWALVDKALDGLAASISSAGYADVPIYELGDKRAVAAQEDAATGNLMVEYEQLVYGAYLRADFSILFNAAKALDGADLQDDLAAVPPLMVENPDDSLWFDPEASSFGQFVSGLLEDVRLTELTGEFGPVTEPEAPLQVSTGANGTLLVDGTSGEVLGIEQAAMEGFAVQTSTIRYTAEEDDWEFRVGFAYLQYRNVELQNPANNATRGWVDFGVTIWDWDEDGVNQYQAYLGADSFASVILTDGDGIQVGTAADWATSYSNDEYYLNCATGTCSEPMLSSYVGFMGSDLPAGLAAGSYTITGTTGAGRVAARTLQYGGARTIPFVPSSGMNAVQGTDGSVSFGWSNPTAEANWNQLDQLRLYVLDENADSLLTINVGMTQSGITIPASIFALADDLRSLPAVTWQLQGRALDTNFMNDARSYSLRVPMP